MARVTRSEGTPHDRLTGLTDVAVSAIEASGEYRPGDRFIVIASDDDNGGLVLHGYDDDDHAIADLIFHLRALMRSKGKDLQVHLMPGRG